jgi:hypothetical protein
MILSYLTNDTLARTALVCRRWYEVSLDMLWCKVWLFDNLCNMLVPIVDNVSASPQPAIFECGLDVNRNSRAFLLLWIGKDFNAMLDVFATSVWTR